MDDDSTLMASFQDGDHESFEKLIVKYRLPAVAFARKYLTDLCLAEDVVQESFADLFVYRERYNRKFSFKTYLFSIIKHKCLTCRRQRKWLSLHDTEISSGQTPEQELVRQESRNIVRRKINELKDDYRTVLYLAEYEDFSYEEIARIMGRNLGQIKILLFRARKKLKALLEKEA